MISLKSKKDKKKMMKGGSITNPDEKKLIFDALFQLCDSIIEDTDFQQFGDFKDTNQISFNNYNYLYLILKYFFGLLFTNIFTDELADSKNNIELFKKLSKYFNIYYNNIRGTFNPTIDDNYCRDFKIFFNSDNITDFELTNMENTGQSYTLYSYFKRAIYELFKTGGFKLKYNNNTSYLNFRIQLQSDILCNNINNSCLFDKYYVQSLLVHLYNFILENYSFNDFLSFIKSLNNIDITAEYKNIYEDYIQIRNPNDSIDKILTIFNKHFKNIFKSTLFKEKDLTLEDNLRKVLNKSTGISSEKLSPSDKNYLTKKAFEYQSKFLSSSDNSDLLLSGLEAFKYYNSLNDFDNSINIIKKILDIKFNDTNITDSKQFNQLNLLLALLYYNSADKTAVTIEDFNFKYINNLLLAIYYFNKYFTDINNKQTDIDNQSIKDLIANATKDYNEFELNILTIYVELIKKVCNFVKDYKFVDDFDKRQLLQLLFIAYTFYKQIDIISITPNNPIDYNIIPIIYPLKEKQTEGTAEYNKLFKLIDKESKDNLLSLLTAEIKKFTTIDLMRLFFFRNDITSNLGEIENKLKDISLYNYYYNEYFEKDTTDFKTNIFSEILKFDKNKNQKLPYGLDVLFSIYKYNVQIPLSPTDKEQEDKYKSHVLEVFKNKDKYKEQFEFFKTLLNVFYMNISVLYYNLFISNPRLFEDFKKEIEKFANPFDETKINKKEILDIVFKEENKADIISNFIYHLRTLFQENKEINSDNIQFLLILFNNLYTSNEYDLMNFLCAMYSKLFNITINNPVKFVIKSTELEPPPSRTGIDEL